MIPSDITRPRSASRSNRGRHRPLADESGHSFGARYRFGRLEMMLQELLQQTHPCTCAPTPELQPGIPSYNSVLTINRTKKPFSSWANYQEPHQREKEHLPDVGSPKGSCCPHLSPAASAAGPWRVEPSRLAQDQKPDSKDWGVSVQQTAQQAYILLLLQPAGETQYTRKQDFC